MYVTVSNMVRTECREETGSYKKKKNASNKGEKSEVHYSKGKRSKHRQHNRNKKRLNQQRARGKHS